MTTPSHIPNIKNNPVGWFNYFDGDHGGTLDSTEVANGLAETFPSMNKGDITEILNVLWPLFDRDGSGRITAREFAADNGLCDTIVAQLNPHFNEEDAPSSSTPSYPEINYGGGSYSSSHYHQQQSYGGSSYPPQQQQQYAPPQNYHAPPQYDQPPQSNHVQIRCGHCQQTMSVIAPNGVREFQSKCPSCSTMNMIRL